MAFAWLFYFLLVNSDFEIERVYGPYPDWQACQAAHEAYYAASECWEGARAAMP